MSDKTINIIIAEDHQVVRHGLVKLLNESPGLKVVGDVGTGAEAVAETKKQQPHVLLLDIRLPDQSGIDVCKSLRQANVSTRILVLTSIPDRDVIRRAIMAGADGYLIKDVNLSGLVQGIKEVAAGKSIIDPATTRELFNGLKAGGQDKLEKLTAQERNILAQVAEGKPNREIADDFKLSEKTVKNHLSNILAKLELKSRSQAAVLYVRENLGKH